MKDEISKKFYEKYLKQKNNRLPDIIISGVKKCGTKGKTHFNPIWKVYNFHLFSKLFWHFYWNIQILLAGEGIDLLRKIIIDYDIACSFQAFHCLSTYVTVKENIIGIPLETFHLTWVVFLDIFMTKNRLDQPIF